MTETNAIDTLDYYRKNGAALFPIPAGSKAPHGLVESFKHDWSKDPAQWARWSQENPHCNFGVVAFASQWIICDIDTSGGEAGRAEAWALWVDLCASWGIPTAAPHVQSARGGWHVYFAVPPHVDASTLRQPDAIKKRINVRCIGYTVAAGSYYDGTAKGEQSGPYLLMSSSAPHPCPAALLTHCSPRVRPQGIQKVGVYDFNDAMAFYQWMAENGVIQGDEDWRNAGMAARIEFGDDGLELWKALATNQGDLSAESMNRWNSFSTEPTSDSVTLNTLLKQAHAAGWTGTVRKSTAAMFDGVAQLAAMAGASLSSGMPTGAQSVGMPMMAGQEELARLAAPILADFLDTTKETPAPSGAEWPTLPQGMSGHGLYEPMCAAIARVIALSEAPKWKPGRVTDPLAVLNLLHADVFDAVARRVRSAGHTLQDKRIRLAAANLSEKVERITVTQDKWEYDKTGCPESDNSDNVVVLLGVLGLELRWNAWLERMEIQGGIDSDLRWPSWSYVDDTVVAKLRTRANRTKTRFRPGKDFLWEALLTIAHGNSVDPVLETLSTLAGAWDGTPRLATWLATYCGTPDDAYHQAVGKLIVGGMVKRARHPGCKFDFMPIFFGHQGTGKSTLAAILSDMGATPLNAIAAGNGRNFTDNVMLGDASKELVLSLAGKLVAEIGEMGTRGNANVTHVKAMLSRQVDAGRTAYARAVSERPRRNIFIGTTNDENPLTDTTGNRRFLPVHITQEIDLVAFHGVVEQLVGEATALEAAGTTFELPREIWSEAAAHQEAARSVGDVEARLCAWFAETPYTAAAFISTEDLAELCDLAGWRNVHGFRNDVLKRLGFREVQPRINGVKTRGWLRGSERPEAATRYAVGRTAEGRPKVSVRLGSARACPPLPYEFVA